MSEINFKEKQERRDRGISVNDIVDYINKKKNNIDSIIVLATHKDGEIQASYSLDNDVEAIGILEIAKTELLHGMLYID